jgi:hypothetical protein
MDGLFRPILLSISLQTSSPNVNADSMSNPTLLLQPSQVASPQARAPMGRSRYLQTRPITGRGQPIHYPKNTNTKHRILKSPKAGFRRQFPKRGPLTDERTHADIMDIISAYSATFSSARSIPALYILFFKTPINQWFTSCSNR